MRWYLLVALMLVIFGCKNNSTDPAGTFKLSGYVYYGGVAAKNASIRVDDSSHHTAASNEQGYFEINNLEKGSHTLYIHKDLPNNSFSMVTMPVEITQDVNLDNLLLPRGVQLLPPENITSNSLHLKWTATDAADFREYKVYQHETSGLDETTGTLIHVATSIEDTVFSVTSLSPFNPYYFRIYVMNDYGKLGGSNIVSALTENQNLIANSGFEVIDSYSNFAQGWETSPSAYVEIDQTESYDGNNSLHFYGVQGEYSFATVSIDIDPNLFLAGTAYELSMWVKHDSLADYHSGWIDIYPGTFHFLHFDGPRQSSEWVRHTKILYTPSDMTGSYYGFQIHFAQMIKDILPDLPLNIWIDKIELKRKD